MPPVQSTSDAFVHRSWAGYIVIEAQLFPKKSVSDLFDMLKRLFRDLRRFAWEHWKLGGKEYCGSVYRNVVVILEIQDQGLGKKRVVGERVVGA